MSEDAPERSTVREALRIVAAADRLDAVPSGAAFVQAIADACQAAKRLRADQLDETIAYLHERYDDVQESDIDFGQIIGADDPDEDEPTHD